MSKQRKITITEAEFMALVSAIDLWENEVIDNLDMGNEDIGWTRSDANREYRAMQRVLAKWREAGRSNKP